MQVIDSKDIKVTVVIHKDVLHNVNKLRVKLVQFVLMSYSNLLNQRGELTTSYVLL